MVGRTPEYLGKKIEAYDVKMAMLVVLVFPLVILIFAAISSVEAFRNRRAFPIQGPTDSARFCTPSRRARATMVRRLAGLP